MNTAEQHVDVVAGEQPLLFAPYGVPKSAFDHGLNVECEPKLDRPEILYSSVVGTMVHAVVALQYSGKTPEEQRQLLNARYYGSRSVDASGKIPPVIAYALQQAGRGMDCNATRAYVRRLARPALQILHFASSIAVPQNGEDTTAKSRIKVGMARPGLFQEYLAMAHVAAHWVDRAIQPPLGHGMSVAAESHFSLPRQSIEAGTILGKRLACEQSSAAEMTQVEQLLRTHPWFSSDVVSTDADSGDPVSDSMQELLDNVRGHRRMYNGDTIACPTARPDLMTFTYETEDAEAREVAHAVREVFKTAGRLYDISALKAMEIPFADSVCNAIVVLHKAVSMLGTGRLTLQIYDIKTRTHVTGRQPNETATQVRHKYDVAKTVFAVMNLFRTIENSTDSLPRVSVHEMYAHVQAAILDVDFNITSDEYLEGDLSPALWQLGARTIMSSESVRRIDVATDELDRLRRMWEYEIHAQLQRRRQISQAKGRVAADIAGL